MTEDTDLLKENQERREAVRARDEFLAIAAHELRSPMHALMLQVASAIALARRSGGDEPSLREFEITARGIEIGEPIHGVEAAMSGFAREPRVVQPGGRPQGRHQED